MSYITKYKENIVIIFERWDDLTQTFSQSTYFYIASMHYFWNCNKANRTGLLSDMLFKCLSLITAVSQKYQKKF